VKPEDFWDPFSETVGSFDEATKLIHEISTDSKERRFAWRGVADASWALHSSLYRRLLWKVNPGAKPPTEKELHMAELRVIRAAQRWELHSGERGRLSMFEFLATLQHFRAPTRFIDVTFNPYAALFFATEDKKMDGVDGRVFAVEVTGRSINGHESAAIARWDRLPDLPWASLRNRSAEPWGHSSYVWKPTGFNRRIAAQQGGFLFGGVPAAKRGEWPKHSGSPSPKWKIEDVRLATCVATRPHKIARTRGKGPRFGAALFSFRVEAAAKGEIRRTLNRVFNLTHATMYPDFPGFADFALGWLPSVPP
jgi:hypothetical protein